MMAGIPSDLLELLKCSVSGNINDYQIESLNNEKGEGFVGEIIFVTFTHKVTGQKTELIVKQEQEKNGETVEKFRALCQNELNFYNVIWPFLNKYYKNVGKRDLDFVPKCLGSSNTGRATILLENLIQHGFLTYDKTKPFDDAHCRIIFETYGIFHGISMALRELDNEQYQRLISHKINFFMTAFEGDFFSKGFLSRLQEVQAYFDPVVDEDIVKRLKVYEESGIKKIVECFKEDCPNVVILHGDCWSNNLMFKYDEQRKPKDVKLLDFQLVCNGSPILDLSYCLYSAADEDILNKLDDYLNVYHNSLTETLKEFGLDSESIYPLKTFKEEWKKYCKYGFPLGMFLWRLKLLPRDAVPDLTVETGEMKTVALAEDVRELYKKRIRELITHLCKNDFI